MQVIHISEFSFNQIGLCYAMHNSHNAINKFSTCQTKQQFNSENKISDKSRNPAPEYAARIPTLRLRRLLRSRTRLPYRFYLEYIHN